MGDISVLSGERSVSSLLGVVLMVAVVVIVGSTLTVFAFSFGDSVSSVAPTADIEFESRYFGDGVAKNDSVVVTHDGGDRLRRTQLEVVVGGTTVFNETDDSESNNASPSTDVKGLVVEIDGDQFNDLNKPPALSPAGTRDGPPGDSDGSDPGVVNEWEENVTAGQRLVVQERNAGQSVDVLQPCDRIRVIWRGDEETAIIDEGVVGPSTGCAG
ncbi:type IV pilin [Halomicroarcula sp. GCM10025709]|uniref:type IV pilin n=1 Tax=Haloarcula TaxID=2237 RepID=UPI0024C3F99E|nr:type IV pilin [Halomicroarcula sp. YJ-61-S]